MALARVILQAVDSAREYRSWSQISTTVPAVANCVDRRWWSTPVNTFAPTKICFGYRRGAEMQMQQQQRQHRDGASIIGHMHRDASNTNLVSRLLLVLGQRPQLDELVITARQERLDVLAVARSQHTWASSGSNMDEQAHVLERSVHDAETAHEAGVCARQLQGRLAR